MAGVGMVFTHPPFQDNMDQVHDGLHNVIYFWNVGPSMWQFLTILTTTTATTTVSILTIMIFSSSSFTSVTIVIFDNCNNFWPTNFTWKSQKDLLRGGLGCRGRGPSTGPSKCQIKRKSWLYCHTIPYILLLTNTIWTKVQRMAIHLTSWYMLVRCICWSVMKTLQWAFERQKINYEANNGQNLTKHTTHYLYPYQIQVWPFFRPNLPPIMVITAYMYWKWGGFLVRSEK